MYPGASVRPATAFCSRISRSWYAGDMLPSMYTPPSTVARKAFGTTAGPEGLADPFTAIAEEPARSRAGVVQGAWIGMIVLTTSPSLPSDTTSSLFLSSSVTPPTFLRKTTRFPSMSATSHSFSPMAVTALDHKVAKWRATSVRPHSPCVAVEDGVVRVRIETDFMRSATAIVAGWVEVEG